MKLTKSQKMKAEINAKAAELVKAHPQANRRELDRMLMAEVSEEHKQLIVGNYVSRSVWEMLQLQKAEAS